MCQTYNDYLKLHANTACRRMHYAGLMASFFWGLASLASENRWWLLPVCFVWIYGFAWTGHWMFAGNHPPTFQDLPWSIPRAMWFYWKMIWDTLRGRILA